MLFVLLGLVATLFAIAGIVGGALAQKKPAASWTILLIAGFGGFITGPYGSSREP